MRKSLFIITSVFALAGLAACSDGAPTQPGNSGCPVSTALRLGEVRTFSGAGALSCVALASVAESSQFVLIAANASPTSDGPQSFVLSSNVGATAANARTLASAFPTELGDLQATLESRVRETERRLAKRSPSLGQPVAHAAKTTIQTQQVGDTLRLRVANAASSDLCGSFVEVRATVKAVSSKAIVALDLAAPPGGFADADFAALASEFDQLILPTDIRWFGDPTDMNADGHVTILFTPRINALTPTGSLGYVGGFFFASDLMPRSVPSENWHCDSSNEQEIFYLLTPDPNGTINGNRFSIPTAYEAARGTIAHEMQHMINQGIRRRTDQSATLEVAWLNEGLSHLAEELVGRASRKYADGRRLTWDDILFDLDDFDSFFRQNLIRYRQWLGAPTQSSPISRGALNELSSRGAAWALVRYAIDQYAGADPAAFTRALVAGPEVDVSNLERRTQRPFEEVLSGFLTATFADQSLASTRFAFSSWSMRSVLTELSGGLFPLRTDPLPSAATIQSPSGSGSYFVLSRPPGARESIVRIQSTSGGPVDVSGARLIVWRTR